MNEYVIKPIAYINNDLKTKFGVPRQSGLANELLSEIVFEPEYRTLDALRAIEQFSHLWLIFDFSKAHKEGWSATVRPPRLGGNERVGVFASRSPFRPNPIGLSCVKLEGIKQRADVGATLIVSGADLLDNTPIFDIKPYLPYADCRIDAVGGYADEKKDYRLQVEFPAQLLEKIPKDKQGGLLECLADDPRPSYQDDPLREYGMRFADFEIKFTVNADTLTVFAVFETE
jgi:tRNA-Thr(GGU) m(6)t(6)A37 methyltransferase TsaA